MADARDDALFDDLRDEARGLGPFGRNRDQADVAAGGILEAKKLIEIGRADPAGRMGAARTTVQSLTVHAVDGVKNLLLIKGAVPGPRGGLVVVRAAAREGN